MQSKEVALLRHDRTPWKSPDLRLLPSVLERAGLAWLIFVRRALSIMKSDRYGNNRLVKVFLFRSVELLRTGCHHAVRWRNKCRVSRGKGPSAT